jgi:hypothetical protein
MANINATIAGFLRSHKSGTAKAVAITQVAIQHWLDTRDWTPLARLAMGVEPRMKQRILKIVGVALGGVTGQIDTKAAYGYRFKAGDNFGPSEKFADLQQLVADGAAIYSEAMDTFLGLDVKVAKAFDAKDYATAVHAKLAKNEVDRLAFVKLLLADHPGVLLAIEAAVSPGAPCAPSTEQQA